ncbi:MAG: hypothetical protein GY834_16615, partial [Bacteroidetes bacterium]|nr:hypothetical protein [Bacteroidota bacterium]
MKKIILEASLKKMTNIIMRLYGITEKKDDCLKSSTGLQSVYIDMSRFNMKPFIETGLHHKMLPILFKVFSGITKARKD